jgi:hypothetical protein
MTRLLLSLLWGLVALGLPCVTHAQVTEAQATDSPLAWQRYEFKGHGYSLEFPGEIRESESVEYNPRYPGCFKRGNQATWNGIEPSTMKRPRRDLPTVEAYATPDVHPDWRGREAAAAAQRARVRQGVVVGLRWEHDDTKAFELRDGLNDMLFVFSTWNIFLLFVEHPDPHVRSRFKEHFFNSFHQLPCLNS